MAAKKKSKKTKAQITREQAIEQILADVDTWEPHTHREWVKTVYGEQLRAEPNNLLLLELDKAYPEKYHLTDSEIVGEFKTYEKLLELIAEEADEHENQVNDADGALAGAEHRGTDFQDALAIAWKLLTPDQRKKAFLEFKESHDFAAYDKKEVG